MANKTSEQFHQALIKEDLDSIDKCIQNGLGINQCYSCTKYLNASDCYGTSYKFTPINCAVENGSIKVVRHLLGRGADVLQKYPYFVTPLSLATQKGNLEMVKLLLENGAEPTVQTALLVAIENKKLDILQFLLEKEACINWKYKYGETPLSKSITTDKCEEISKFLIDNGAILDELVINGSTPLILSVEYKRIDTFKYLLKRGADVNKVDNNGRTALSVTASRNNFSLAKYLIEFGADLSLAQTEIDKYAQRDEDFNFFLKLFKMKHQLKLSNPVREEVSIPKSNCKCLQCHSLQNLPERQLGNVIYPNPPSNTDGVKRAADNPSYSRTQAKIRRGGETTVVRRQGNIHRLSNKNDSDNENNTWNGNSAQYI